MISIKISDQKKWLDENLGIELLISKESNKVDIQKFVSSGNGKNLETYLKCNAWEEDNNGGTKVYLVRDRNTRDIVFFFALKAGLLYKAIGDTDYTLTETEKEILDLALTYHFDEDPEHTEETVLAWYEDDESIDRDRMRRIIDEAVEERKSVKFDQNKTEEGENVVRVSSTFPGIVLTHFCKNSEYAPSVALSIPLGFYVFWEIIIAEVLNISNILGCQYLYLFAADQTEEARSEISIDYLSDESVEWHSAINKGKKIRELVDYYKNELGFEDVIGIRVLKPVYDEGCFSLLQPINNLCENRKAAWIRHSDVDMMA